MGCITPLAELFATISEGAVALILLPNEMSLAISILCSKEAPQGRRIEIGDIVL